MKNSLGLALLALTLPVAAGAATLLIAGGAMLARRRERPDWVLLLWGGATLLVTAIAGQPYAHFLVPAVAPLALLVAGLGVSWARSLRTAGWRPIAGLAPEVAGVVIAGVMASVAGSTGCR